MNADRWRVVKGLFQRAIQLPEGDWPAYLDSVSAGDEELRRDVASLLSEHVTGAPPSLTPVSSEEVTLRLATVRPSDEVSEISAVPGEPIDG